MVLGNTKCGAFLLLCIIVGHGSSVLAVDAGGSS